MGDTLSLRRKSSNPSVSAVGECEVGSSGQGMEVGGTRGSAGSPVSIEVMPLIGAPEGTPSKGLGKNGVGNSLKLHELQLKNEELQGMIEVLKKQVTWC